MERPERNAADFGGRWTVERHFHVTRARRLIGLPSKLLILILGY
ncbi:hypothetical protein NAS2_0809 [Conexivisphaera calida]|uniref:Uncharacterized protein n=1 Tax=Conexivisphaera calida TaxID=1874277 RepID=A0A4P2VMD4_9ARCH|nr:hypothetical protein NAS2_0809 [Conexivisphaera calida]